jgi:hypothetical protein
MSLFKTTELVCPACGKALSFLTVHSVNADRRPDLRAAIVAGEFQRMQCPHCGAAFRLDTDFTLLDIRRGQWIIAAPVAASSDWQAREEAARDLFVRAYGESAPEVAQRIGAKLKPRIVFGWPALTEKLIAADLGLDDVVLEMCKAALMRSSETLSASAVAELRLAGVEGDRLLMVWMRSYDGTAGDALMMPRELYDEVSADAAGGWAGLRQEFDGALFVDLKRMLLKQTSAAAA